MRYHINHFITVGTSIPRNFHDLLLRCHDSPEECPLSIEYDKIADYWRLLEKCLSIPPGSPSEIECINSLGGWSSLHDSILEAVKWNPKRMSAELNAMDPWIKYAIEKDRSYVYRVFLYTTETGAGILAGKILNEYLKQTLNNTPIELRIIKGMRENIWLALRNLVMQLGRDLSETLYSSDDEIIMLNLTGGLKPEGAMALLEVARRSSFNGIAYYIHEIHREPTPIPILATDRYIKEAKKIIAPLLKKPARMIHIPLQELGKDTIWLSYFAAAIEPLGLSKHEEDKILLDVDLARMIIQAEE